MKKYFIPSTLIMFCVTMAFGQADLVVGTTYQFNIQRQGNNADAFLFHNAKYNATTGTYQWATTHSSFGSRGIQMGYLNGITFYANSVATNANGNFTPAARFFIGNNGKVGVGTTDPLEMLHINGNIRGHVSGAIRISTGFGTTEVGAQNTAWSHFQTDRPKFYFQKGITVDEGIVSSYDEPLVLQAAGVTGVKILTSTGNVAIGDASGTTGNLSIGKNTDHAGLSIEAGNTKNAYFNSYENGAIVNSTYWDGNADIFKFRNFALAPFTFTVGNNELMRIQPDGTVGIGTIDPKGYKLAVAGKSVMEDLVIKLQANWPDYVFDPSYDLLPLAQLEQFIKHNKHLPEVPSAEVVHENGYSVGQMNEILLKKIEELTLYVIELQKENDRISAEIEELKNIK